MKMTLLQLIEAAGHASRSYSGRAMYGKRCLGVDIDGSLGPFIGDVMEAMADDVDAVDTDEVVYAFRHMKTDSMGLGTIVYFPTVDYTDEKEDEGGDEEEGEAHP